MTRFVFFAALTIAAASSANANPMILPEYYARQNVPVFVIWCVAGTFLGLFGFKRIYAALIPFAFGLGALALGECLPLLTYWHICLVGLILWLALRKPAVRDSDWILKFGFHAAYFALMVVLYVTPEPSMDHEYMGGHPDEYRAMMKQHQILVVSAKAGIIAAVGLAVYLINFFKIRIRALQTVQESIPLGEASSNEP
ncbi:hypothetical protein LLG95_06795 [bacterium]|nr:hypothetical protein [bacterium]